MEIVECKKEDVMDFNEREWNEVNNVHFGKGVRWNTIPFQFKATENGDTVGLIFGKHESGTTYISNLIVAKDKRLQGIGRKLIEKAEEFAKSFNDHKLWLITGKDYHEDPFFTKVGFKKEVDLPDLYFHKEFIVYIKNI